MAKPEISKRLILITVLLTVLMIIIITLSLKTFNELYTVQADLQKTRLSKEQLQKSDNVIRTLLKVESSFQEYCLTFNKPILEEYKSRVYSLVKNIEVLNKSHKGLYDEKVRKASKDVNLKTNEAENIIRLKQITDSLLTIITSLEINQVKIEKYILQNKAGKIDTLSVSETKEIYKKGLIKKIKGAIVGENTAQKVNTKIRVQSKSQDKEFNPSWLENINEISGLNSIAEFDKRNQELKKSELRLINLNNKFLGNLFSICETINKDTKNEDAEQNEHILSSVSETANSARIMLVSLMILACVLAIYSIYLSINNKNSHNKITSLNKKALSESLQKDKFLSIIGHDLMTPINNLIGFTELLTESAKKGAYEETYEYACIVNKSAIRVSNLLQNLLTWARFQNGKIKYSPKAVNIHDLVENSVAILLPFAMNKQINLNWNVPKDLIAKVDFNMINSVLQNLVTNAIKFTAKNGQVSVVSSIESKTLKFIVSDNGVGMNSNQISNLFNLEHIASTKGTENETGTGLGLIICKDFISLHNGTINVESQPGKGSKFTIKIPLQE